MTRKSQPRWLLGACGLVALIVAGCGAGTKQAASLRAKGEHQLLALVATARTDASNHDAAGLRAALSQFMVDVHSLRASGQLSQKTARGLEQGALATEQQASRQLTTATTVQVASTTTTVTSTQPAPPQDGSQPPGQDGGPPPGKDGGPPKGDGHHGPPDGAPHPPPHGHGDKHGGDGGGND